jgi:hypothetical protein
MLKAKLCLARRTQPDPGSGKWPEPVITAFSKLIKLSGSRTLERLLRFLVALGQDVEIVVKPHQAEKARAALHVS